MTKWAEESDHQAIRAKAIADLAGGAVPPWQQKEILLTSYLVRRRLREELPKPTEEGDRLYVLGFQGLRPVVKVGSTGFPEKRFDTHEAQARNLGYALVDGWISAPAGTRSEASRQETTTLTLLHQVLNGHTPGGRIFEWFHGHDFERIRELVENPKALLSAFLQSSPSERQP
ncbi:hypothetical protein ACFRAO_34400 [Streptomyces sp. NPDC056656]|uniref:hypothetical protein n=1 Tax=Streptomyces sp. NPDC056656 TaxID=3345895 RepID=UPI003684BA13